MDIYSNSFVSNNTLFLLTFYLLLLLLYYYYYYDVSKFIIKFIFYIYIYIYIYITNLPVNTIVRLPDPLSGDSQVKEMFLAPPADKRTHNYDIPPSLPINSKVKGNEP